MPRSPGRRPPPRARSRPVLGAVLALLAAGLGARDAQAGGATDPAACFGRFLGAWSARAPEQIVGCMEAEGKITVRLFAYPLSGKARIMGPEQAQETLKIYFRKIAGIRLKDVTPERSPKNVRLYEYEYRASGENPRTTHLQVKLKQDTHSLWVLDSVTESAKPRS